MFWIAAVLTAVIPYVVFCLNPDLGPSWLKRSGHFADNLTLTIARSLFAIILGGWAWLLICRNPPAVIIPQWANRKLPLNWIWFFFSIAVYTVHNVLLLQTQPMGTVEFLAVASGRFFTAFIVISLLWAAAHLASGVSPRRLRLIPWLIPAAFPGILAVDSIIILLWHNSLVATLNKFDEQGSLNVSRHLAAGGFDYGTIGFLGAVAAALALFALLFYLTHRLSLLKRIGISPKQAVLFLTVTWSLLLVEKATGYLWKDRQVLLLEDRLFQVHLTPLEPDPGVATFSASFKPPLVPEFPEETSDPAKGPDIIFIMVESLRADAVDSKHSPFLARFRDEECQALGATWSASNATHLSWFSIFNGQLPSYWVRSNDLAVETGKLPPSPWIRLLQSRNYRQEVRGVCDFDYNGMSSTNFGLPHVLDVEVNAPVDGQFHQLPQPERELEIIAQSKNSLRKNRDRPHFQFLGLDAPHFGYEWHPDFEPPYTDYDPAAIFSAYPSVSDIRKVRNRYFNAISWVDSLIEDYLNFLKEEGRYEDALIIVTGDHGEEFHEHGSWFHCSNLYPEQTQVPMMIKWPRGTTVPSHQSASHLDLLPSLLDLLEAPAAEQAKLPGRSLLEFQPEESTQITLTPFCGISGISMAWHRNGHFATFSWDNPWSSDLPDQIFLDNIVGPDGSLDLGEREEWDEALRSHFPDAFERFFSRCDLKKLGE